MKANQSSKSIAFIALVVTLLLLITACAAPALPVQSSDAAKASESQAQSSTPAQIAAAITRENTLVWTVPALPPGLDIYYYSTLQTMECIRNIYDSALGFPAVKDESGFLVPDFKNPIGMLAESFKLSDDGKTLTIKLKEGVISHTGNELVADDFIWERDRQSKLIGVKNWQNDGMGITDPKTQIKKIDKYTFQISIDHPNPIFVPIMTHMANHMIDSVEYAKHEGAADDPDGTKWSNTKGSGYGPYKVDSFTPGDNITLLAHDQYWDKTVPLFFKKVIVKEVPKSANRLALVLSGDADAATYLTPKELMEAKGKPGVKVMSWKSNIMTRIEFNCTKEPFNNPLVRKALAYAIPYDEILNTVYLGTATQLKSVIPSSYPGFTDEYFKYSKNFDEAKKLLAEAGYPNGFQTVMEIMADYATDEQIAIIVKDSLKNIGVDVSIEKLQSADYWSKGPSKTFKGMYVFSDMPGVVDGGFSMKLWLQSGVDSNFSGYKNDEVDRLYKETTQTTDQAIREKNFKRIQEITVWEDPAWILLAEPGYHLAVRDDIQDLYWQSLQEIRWANAYRAKK
jgi:peptide/nickel transport system substrate-binding protein